jgi:RES domain-containing protein
MLFYRICRRPFRMLDGEGARLNGGRWNTEGTPLIYTSSTRALAAVEYLAHIDPDLIPSDLVLLSIDVPDDAPVGQLLEASLPNDWAAVPEHPACEPIGDAWARRGTQLGLRVPSAIIPDEENLLINPQHPAASRVRTVSVSPFAFDRRLLR